MYHQEGGERLDLSGYDLSDADLCGFNLSGVKLRNANLNNANLHNAFLGSVDLRGADLKNAFLADSNLASADLLKNEQYRLGKILTRKMIGYKKCRDNLIVTLEIPAGAVVFCINGNKCRTNIAKCIGISDNNKHAYSYYDDAFIYEIGKTYNIKDFNLQYNVECASGIHFYKTLEEAMDY